MIYNTTISLYLNSQAIETLLWHVIGFHTAKHYILSHGEQIVFVKPAESFEGILEILKNIDHREARKLIESERISRSSIRLTFHDPNKLVSKLEEFKKK